MSYLKMLFKIMGAVMVWLLSVSPVFSAECEGNWTVQLDPLSIEYREDLSGYIPGYITLSRDVRYCRNPYVYLSLEDKKRGVVRSQRGDLDVEFIDKNNRHLTYVVNQGYRLKLDNSARTKFWVQLKKARSAPAATYTGQVRASLKLSDKESEKSALLEQKISPFVVFMLDKVKSRNVRGFGEHYAMDLGTLEKGDKHYAYFNLLSNATVDVRVERENGALVHDKKRNLTVGYALTFDGHDVDKTLSYAIVNDKHFNYKHIPMKLVVSDTDFAYAGTYRDVIKIEVKARR